MVPRAIDLKNNKKSLVVHDVQDHHYDLWIVDLNAVRLFSSRGREKERLVGRERERAI